MGKKIIINERQSRFIAKRRLHEVVSYDPSEIGEIACTLDFDEDLYQEYLQDNELTDSPQAKEEYIRNECTYDVELYDAETYHQCGYEQMTIEQIEENFGAAIAADVFKECMDGKEHRYEPLAYDNEVVDLNNPVALSDAAMKRLKHGEYSKNCRGFILPNGVVVYTGAEHNMCSQVPGVQGTYHFIELGCIRVLDHSVDLAVAPTSEQWQTLYDVFNSYYGDTLYLDLMNKQIGVASKQYSGLDPQEAIDDIRNYFNYGTKPRSGYGMYESRRSLKENMDEKTLYHGTNNDFDQFKEEFYLSGVGKMDFGYGVYLTSSVNTAKEYGPGGTIMVVDAPEGKYLNGDRVGATEAMAIARKFYKYYLTTDYGKSAYSGVENEFWEYECSAIAKCNDGNGIYGTVSTILGSDKEASEWLRSIGYIGISYRCQNRATGERFVNYVIFNPNDIRIIEKRPVD